VVTNPRLPEPLGSEDRIIHLGPERRLRALAARVATDEPGAATRAPVAPALHDRAADEDTVVDAGLAGRIAAAMALEQDRSAPVHGLEDSNTITTIYVLEGSNAVTKLYVAEGSNAVTKVHAPAPPRARPMPLVSPPSAAPTYEPSSMQASTTPEPRYAGVPEIHVARVEPAFPAKLPSTVRSAPAAATTHPTQTQTAPHHGPPLVTLAKQPAGCSSRRSSTLPTRPILQRDVKTLSVMQLQRQRKLRRAFEAAVLGSGALVMVATVAIAWASSAAPVTTANAEPAKATAPRGSPAQGSAASPDVATRQPTAPPKTQAQEARSYPRGRQPIETPVSLPPEPLVTESPPAEPLITESPPAEPLVTESPPAEPLITESPPAEPLVTESPPAEPLITEQPPSEPPPPEPTGPEPPPDLLVDERADLLPGTQPSDLQADQAQAPDPADLPRDTLSR
jgi:hypothetical protein